jgi:hypothetical protein
MQVQEKLLGLRRTATTCSFVLYIPGMKSPASDRDMDQTPPVNVQFICWAVAMQAKFNLRRE